MLIERTHCKSRKSAKRKLTFLCKHFLIKYLLTLFTKKYQLIFSLTISKSYWGMVNSSTNHNAVYQMRTAKLLAHPLSKRHQSSSK